MIRNLAKTKDWYDMKQLKQSIDNSSEEKKTPNERGKTMKPYLIISMRLLLKPIYIQYLQTTTQSLSPNQKIKANKKTLKTQITKFPEFLKNSLRKLSTITT